MDGLWDPMAYKQYWLVVLTILKNIKSQWEGLSLFYYGKKNVRNHQPEYVGFMGNISAVHGAQTKKNAGHL